MYIEKTTLLGLAWNGMGQAAWQSYKERVARPSAPPPRGHKQAMARHDCTQYVRYARKKALPTPGNEPEGGKTAPVATGCCPSAGRHTRTIISYLCPYLSLQTLVACISAYCDPARPIE